MNFCTNCGNKLTEGKFCSNCGSKITSTKSNSIDQSVNYLKENIKSVNNEFKQSVVIDNIKHKTILLIGNLIIDFFAIVSIIIIIAQIVSYFAYDNIIPIKKSYFTYLSDSSNISIASFIGETLATTILPFLFMCISGLRKQWMLILALILLFILGAITQTDNAYSQDSDDNESATESTIIKEEETPSTAVDSMSYETPPTDYNEKPRTLEINNMGNFKSNGKSYSYNIKSDGQAWGEFEINVMLKNKIIFTERVGGCGKIYSHQFIDKYIYFICPIAPGGRTGSHITKYYAFDIDKLELNVITYSCLNYFFSECEFDDLEATKDDLTLYKFYKSTIVLPESYETFESKYPE